MTRALLRPIADAIPSTCVSLSPAHYLGYSNARWSVTLRADLRMCLGMNNTSRDGS